MQKKRIGTKTDTFFLAFLSVLFYPAFLCSDFPCLLYLNFILNVLAVFLILPAQSRDTYK